jgi:hypothetical protein
MTIFFLDWMDANCLRKRIKSEGIFKSGNDV